MNGMKIGLFAIVAGVFLFSCAGSNSEEPAPASTTADSLDFNLPEGWQVAETPLTPNLADPSELLAVGTFHLRPGGDNCAHMPQAAMEDMGPEDALVSLQERSAPDESFAPRPASFGPVLTGISFGDAFECTEASQRGDIGVLVWLSFQDRGRGFYLLVAMGTNVSDETRRQIVAFLDNLRFGG
jgi:hypothetical protein